MPADPGGSACRHLKTVTAVGRNRRQPYCADLCADRRLRGAIRFAIAPYDLCNHFSTLFKALTYAARSASVLTSVEATTIRSASSGRPGSRREAGTPPSTPFLASVSTTSAALP